MAEIRLFCDTCWEQKHPDKNAADMSHACKPATREDGTHYIEDQPCADCGELFGRLIGELVEA